MTAHTSSVSRLTRSTLVVAMVAAVALAGSVWAKSNGLRAAPESPRVDVTALLSKIDVANLPTINVEQPF